MVLKEREIGHYYFEIFKESGKKYITKIVNVDEEMFINISTKQYGETDYAINYRAFKERRLATPKEIEHFNQCEKAGEYVEYDSLKTEIDIWY